MNLHPVLRELGLTPDIISKYVVPKAAAPPVAPEVTAVPREFPSRTRRRELRAQRRRLGLNTNTGLPLRNKCRPELQGLDPATYRNNYAKLYRQERNP